MCSASRFMVFNVCVKFHENMLSGFKVMERTRKLLTDTHTQRKDENIIPPWHTSYNNCPWFMKYSHLPGHFGTLTSWSVFLKYPSK